MRKYAKELESKNYSIKYYKLNKNNLNLSYEDKIERILYQKIKSLQLRCMKLKINFLRKE